MTATAAPPHSMSISPLHARNLYDSSTTASASLAATVQASDTLFTRIYRCFRAFPSSKFLNDFLNCGLVLSTGS